MSKTQQVSRKLVKNKLAPARPPCEVRRLADKTAFEDDKKVQNLGRLKLMIKN